MPTYELTLQTFRFPKDLENHKANFRFVVDLRYLDADGVFATTQAILPGLDTFWECDKGRSREPNFVRGNDEGNWATFDMNRVDVWDKLILMLPASKLHSIQFKVFDVNRTDGWDKIKNVLSSIGDSLFGELKSVAPSMFGNATDDIKSYLLKKWAGGDTILYKQSLTFLENAVGLHKTSGPYEIHFSVKSF
jgi:hypothetical protein